MLKDVHPLKKNHVEMKEISYVFSGNSAPMRTVNCSCAPLRHFLFRFGRWKQSPWKLTASCRGGKLQSKVI